MSKQKIRERIRYQLGLQLIDLHEDYRDESPDYDFLIDKILGKLHSQGVVIKVDRELPEMPKPNGNTGSGQSSIVELNSKETIKEVLWRIKQAGFTAVEPLIEENNGQKE